MLDISYLNKINPTLWEIPTSYRDDMRVPARVYAHEAELREISDDRSLNQLVNVATLPGIVGWALAMPDAHEGYGFPVGGVAAFDIDDGVISPGGIGYDINCGVRLLHSAIDADEIRPILHDIGRSIFGAVPSGVGKGGRLKFNDTELNRVLTEGAPYVVECGYGENDDLDDVESGGVLEGADPSLVSDHAKNRGRNQVGTMGAGNHFVEVGFVDTIFDAESAERMGLTLNGVTVLIHTGSRGLGHQVATDYIRTMNRTMPSYGITLPDRELACTPFQSNEGKDYFAAMNAAANFAWSNRQMITHEIREAFDDVLGVDRARLEVTYDVAHNIAKVEDYEVKGEERRVVVHRKGATRAFPKQPVMIPGSMGTASYVLEGMPGSLTGSFGSTCHGAGRRMSRRQARKQTSAETLQQELDEMGIAINAGSKRGITEEAPLAYKDVDDVVNVVQEAGIAKKVARLRPLSVIKG